MNSPWLRNGGGGARSGSVNRWVAGCYRYNYRKDPPMRSPGSALSFAFLCLLLVGCSRTSTSVKAASAADEPSASDSPIHKPAPDFALKDRDGATVHLSDYKGKVVMLDFWATWCGPCKIEIPWFMEFEQQYKDKGFAVLGVSMDEGGWDDVKPYIERTENQLPHPAGRRKSGPRIRGDRFAPHNVFDRPLRQDRGSACGNRKRKERVTG